MGVHIDLTTYSAEAHESDINTAVALIIYDGFLVLCSL